MTHTTPRGFAPKPIAAVIPDNRAMHPPIAELVAAAVAYIAVSAVLAGR